MKELCNSVSFNGEEYFMQSQSLSTVCDKFETPFFLYDVNYMLNQYDTLKKCLPWNRLKAFYAMKANYNPHVLSIMRDHGFYLETVSPAEVLLAIKLGYDRKKILFTSNNMTDEEMDVVRQEGILFNIDSLSRLESYGKAYPGASVSLRINPDVIAGENDKVQTAGDASKFGILLADVSKAVEIARKYGVKIIGLHEHTGSGISNVTKVYESIHNLLNIINPQDFPDLEFVDIGGGFKVAYHPDEKKIDYNEFGQELVKIFGRFCESYGRELDLYIEPGKFIVAEAGCLMIKVNTVKNNKGRLIVGTDSGFPHLIRPILYDAYHHIVNVSNPHGAPMKYDIYGNICESGDCFASEREIAEIRTGDYLAIMNAGAYCRSMASEYNLRPMPSEYLVYNDAVTVSKQKVTHAEMADKILKEYGISSC